MATSTIPALKAALTARLQTAFAAEAGYEETQVSYGVPYPRTTEKDWVWVANATGVQVSAAMGRRRREETWQQDIVVSVLRTNRNDQQDITERAFTIAGVIEDSLRAWSEVTGNYFDQVARTALVVGMDLSESVSDTEREARIVMRIDCANRI